MYIKNYYNITIHIFHQILYFSEVLERVLRDIQILKVDVKTLIQMGNNDKLTDYQTLDSQLSFSSYDDLQGFNQKLSDQDYYDKMVSLSNIGKPDLKKIYLCIQL